MKDYWLKGFIMGISSLGVGSSILTQDVLDQLRAADDAARIQPITLDIANETDKKDALAVVDAMMTNFIDSINAVKSATLWDERSATVSSGTSVEVTAASNTDVQDFTLNVTNLATKQIEQSGIFSAKTDVVDTVAGSFDIQVGTGTAVTINYDANATLDDIKNLINEKAGSLVDATIVQTNLGEFHLFLSSVATGDETGVAGETGTNISITSASGLDTRLTTDFDAAAVQSGVNATFTFNGSAPISRASNNVDDLITGLTITLKESGVSNVSIAQDRTSILEKFDSFVEKYNAAMTELDSVTKSSTDSSERGIFSADSTVKSMKRSIQSMIESVGGGVGSMIDYGFSVDKDGTMTLNKATLEAALDSAPENTQAFFSGGDYTKADMTVVTLDGAFAEMSVTIEDYTKTNTVLDQLRESIIDTISTLEERKTSATERLDAKYEIMKKQYAAYDAIIAKFNSVSSMFTQMANASSSSNN